MSRPLKCKYDARRLSTGHWYAKSLGLHQSSLRSQIVVVAMSWFLIDSGPENKEAAEHWRSR